MSPARRAASLLIAPGIAPLVTACTSSSETVTASEQTTPASANASGASTPSQAPCKGRTVSLGPLHRRVVVTEISDVIRSSRGKSFTAGLRPVHTVTPSVDASGAVDTTAVFAEFAEKAGPDIAPLGEASPREGTSGRFTVEAAGAMVTYESVQRVEASFTYRCGNATVSGVVTSWGRPRTGIMQCDDPKQPTAEIVTEVAALAC